MTGFIKEGPKKHSAKSQMFNKHKHFDPELYEGYIFLQMVENFLNDPVFLTNLCPKVLRSAGHTLSPIFK